MGQRKSPSFSRSPALPEAPWNRCAGCPSLNTMSVGMLMMSNWRARSGFSSTLTLATLILSAFSLLDD